MKKQKFNGKGAVECRSLDWTTVSDTIEKKEKSRKKDDYKWDIDDVEESWSVDFDENGRRIDKKVTEPSEDGDDLGASIVHETLNQIAREGILKADGEFVTGEIDAAAVNASAKKSQKAPAAQRPGQAKSAQKPGQVQSAQRPNPVPKAKKIQSPDEETIRKSVDEKIIIKSEELKDKRNAKAGKKKPSKVSARKEEVASSTPSYRNQKGLDKYRKQGTLPTKGKGASKSSSDFRRSSANWRYDNVAKVEVTDETINEAYDNELFIDKLRRMTPIQYMAAGMAIVVLVTAVLTTGVYADYRSELNKAAAFAGLPSFTESETVAYDEGFAEEEIVMEEAAAEPIEEENRILSLVLTSVEKDLKIKLVDDEDTLVKDLQWGVSVTDSDGDESEYEDEDKDGIIHLTDIKAGDYTVAVLPHGDVSGYTFPTIGQQVSVKAKVEYKVIANIKEEIKKESEVNAALEDNGNKAADVETGEQLVDTVTWVESTEEATGNEEYEEATVDLSKTERIVAFTDRLKTAFKNVVSNITEPNNNSVMALVRGALVRVADKDEDSGDKSEPSLAAPQPENDDSSSSASSSSSSEKADDSSTSSSSEKADDSSTSSSSASEEIVPDDSSSSSSDSSSSSLQDTSSSSSQETSSSSSSSEILEDSSTSSSSELVEEIKSDNSSETEESAAKVEAVSINKTSASITVDETLALTLEYSPSNAKPETIRWASVDSAIASVSDGVVRGVSAGKTKVGAIIDGSIAVYCEVTVTDGENSSIVLSGPTSLGIGETITITATCTPDTVQINNWTSESIDIASIITDGNKCYVKGEKAGETVIKAVTTQGETAEFKIKVTDEQIEYSDQAQLYDSNKNKLYVFDNNEYRLAKYADYKSGNFTKYFRKIADIVYTGWQTIDGLTYYFTEDHEKVTGDQVIGGVTYHFGTDGALSKGSGVLGIDVSKYQPSINWASVKASGVNYVIIRCGYRGASTGSLIQDPYFTSHIKGAKDAGLKVGVYFFSTALNETEAVEEASMCAALCSGYGINYPIFIDVEPSSRAGYNSLSREQRTANIKAFCSTISSAGYTPGLYANKTWLTEYINTSSLSCKIWLAQYNSAGPTYTGHYDIWQYTSKGKVDGISGNVDMNQSYLGY